jgi:hypothetical protein
LFNTSPRNAVVKAILVKVPGDASQFRSVGDITGDGVADYSINSTQNSWLYDGGLIST